MIDGDASDNGADRLGNGPDVVRYFAIEAVEILLKDKLVVFDDKDSIDVLVILMKD